MSPSDEDIFTNMTNPNTNTNRLPSPPALSQQADDDDDVWGSPTATTEVEATSASHHHPSDIPRLRQEHSTSGYRDGVAAAKGQSIQAGFDEGFGLGATIGAQAGRLLGLLEGLAAALAAGEGRGGSGEGEDAAAAVAGLLERAREELGIRSVFGSEYWEADGTWKYEVGSEGKQPESQPESDLAGEEAGEIVFADVAAAHPLLKKWEALVKTEVERWDIDLSVLAEDDAAARDHVESQPKKKEIKTAPQSREALQW